MHRVSNVRQRRQGSSAFQASKRSKVGTAIVERSGQDLSPSIAVVLLGEGNKGLLNVVVCSTLSVVPSIFIYQRLENLQTAGASSCGTLVPDLEMSIANLV